MSGHCERCGETAACCCHADDLAFESAISELEARAKRIAALEAANAKQAARIAELEDEREKLEKQEPVAMMAVFDDRSSCVPISDTGVIDAWKAAEFDIRKLYTRPVPARTLTDKVIINIAQERHRAMPDDADEQMELLAIAYDLQDWLKGGE